MKATDYWKMLADEVLGKKNIDPVKGNQTQSPTTNQDQTEQTTDSTPQNETPFSFQNDDDFDVLDDGVLDIREDEKISDSDRKEKSNAFDVSTAWIVYLGSKNTKSNYPHEGQNSKSIS